MTISEIIRGARDELGFSLRDMAAELDCSYQAVNLWEQGRQSPTYERMYYAYTHAALPQIRMMAYRAMRELDNSKWVKDTANDLIPTDNHALSENV